MPVLTCEDYATYYDVSCNWNGVSASDVNYTAGLFPAQYPNDPMTADAGNITQAYDGKENSEAGQGKHFTWMNQS